MIIIQAGFDNFSFNLSIFAAAGWLTARRLDYSQTERQTERLPQYYKVPASSSLMAIEY